MKNIIILSSSIFGTEANANGICAGKLADQFVNNGCNVDVVCYRSNGEYAGKATVHQINNISYQTIQKRKKSFSKLRGLFFVIKRFFVSSDYNKDNEANYCAVCENLIYNNQIDALVAIYFPMETAFALRRIKKNHPAITTFLYELDKAYALEKKKLSFKLIRFTHQRTMKRIYRNCDRVVVMRSHEAYWHKNYAGFVDKLLISDLPMLVKPTPFARSVVDNSRSITILYTGLLDKTYRNPQAAIDVLGQEVFSQRNCITVFFTKGNCVEMLNDACKKHCNFLFHEYIEKELLDQKTADADFLLSIGNLNSDSVPSKLIYYISMGKPIIHFAYDEKDSCLYYLEKYPLSVVLFNSEPLEEKTRKLIGFIDLSLGRRLDFNEIANVFQMNTPQFSCDLIINSNGAKNARKTQI